MNYLSGNCSTKLELSQTMQDVEWGHPISGAELTKLKPGENNKKKEIGTTDKKGTTKDIT